MRQRREYSGPVAGISLGAPGAPMIHAAGDQIGIRDNLMTALAFDVRNKANAARILFVLRAVQATIRQKVVRQFDTHTLKISNLSSASCNQQFVIGQLWFAVAAARNRAPSRRRGRVCNGPGFSSLIINGRSNLGVRR